MMIIYDPSRFRHRFADFLFANGSNAPSAMVWHDATETNELHFRGESMVLGGDELPSRRANPRKQRP